MEKEGTKVGFSRQGRGRGAARKRKAKEQNVPTKTHKRQKDGMGAKTPASR
jgi:hypothetical protein